MKFAQREWDISRTTNKRRAPQTKGECGRQLQRYTRRNHTTTTICTANHSSATRVDCYKEGHITFKHVCDQDRRKSDVMQSHARRIKPDHSLLRFVQENTLKKSEKKSGIKTKPNKTSSRNPLNIKRDERMKIPRGLKGKCAEVEGMAPQIASRFGAIAM